MFNAKYLLQTVTRVTIAATPNSRSQTERINEPVDMKLSGFYVIIMI